MNKKATTRDAQGNITRNPDTVTHTSDENVEQKLLSYQNIPIITLPTNPGIDQGVVTIY